MQQLFLEAFKNIKVELQHLKNLHEIIKKWIDLIPIHLYASLFLVPNPLIQYKVDEVDDILQLFLKTEKELEAEK